MNEKLKPYIIATAGSIEELENVVCSYIKSGYTPHERPMFFMGELGGWPETDVICRVPKFAQALILIHNSEGDESKNTL